jgi:hypothetical protein
MTYSKDHWFPQLPIHTAVNSIVVGFFLFEILTMYMNSVGIYDYKLIIRGLGSRSLGWKSGTISTTI